MILFIMAALIVGFFLGAFASHRNFVLPAQESEATLRKELAEARMAVHEFEFRAWQREVGVLDDTLDAIGYSWVTKDLLMKEYLVSHFDLTEPKIERRGHSDVFKIDSIDALIEGTR